MKPVPGMRAVITFVISFLCFSCSVAKSQRRQPNILVILTDDMGYGNIGVQGADVNETAPDTGESPLHAALCTTNRQTHDAVVSVLLANGANPNCATKPSVTTDHFMRDCKTKGETPLHRAAAFGMEATIQMLLEAGARVDATDMNGDSPLSWASWYLRPRPILNMLCYGPFHT